MLSNPEDCGRFAPSPTGSLHFGSLVAAVASYADALHNQGRWLVRMEDVDETRVVHGSANDILETLESFGFEWESPIIHQSQRKERYRNILYKLQQKGLTYNCSCSRRRIADQAKNGVEGIIYPGTCRKNISTPSAGKAVRLLTSEKEICFIDQISGQHCQIPERDVGDFIIRRADGYTAYQLAVVVDDADQGITHIIRGADLLLSTPRQIYIQQLLGFPQPEYAHIPLVTDALGRKLSKQDMDHPVAKAHPLSGLRSAWQFLQQKTPPEDITSTCDFWSWATINWCISSISSQGASA
jgi:glutamyl-Q tRNA(Asp) synthetase